MPDTTVHISVVERFLRYVTFDTRSSENSQTFPSTAGQLDLLRCSSTSSRRSASPTPTMDEHGYVMATIPATAARGRAGDRLHRPRRHLARDARRRRQADRAPRLRRARSACCRTIPTAVLRAADDPALARADRRRHRDRLGLTLLGADDKAGVAEIMAAAEYLVTHPEIPHGAIRVGFTPDEEIGARRGITSTSRGSAPSAPTRSTAAVVGEMEIESFSADAMTVTSRASTPIPATRRAHGQRDQGRRRLHLALPKEGMSPETTDGYEGYVHPYQMHAAVDRTAVKLLIAGLRDGAAEEKEALRRAARPRRRSPAAGRAVEIAVERAYRNMREVLDAASATWSITRATRSGAPASSRSNGQSAAAPTDRGCRSWGCPRPTSSPASTTSTRGWSGFRRRTWRRRWR